MSTTVTTGKVRFSYCHIFSPYSNNGTEPKYSMSVIIPKSDTKTIQEIKAACKEAAEKGKTSKWGGKIPANLKTPLRDGDEERPDDPAYANSYFFNCSSKKRPGIVDKSLQLILDPEEVESGDYGRVNVNFYAYDATGNRGIAAGLNHVQLLSKGEPLGYGVSVKSAFGDEYADDDEGGLLD